MVMEAATSRPLAVVTGASSGIGLELAKQFATNGFDLIVTAEDGELTAARDVIAATAADATVEAVRADLRTETGVDELYDRIRAAGRPVDAIARNAGVGRGGAFTDTPSTTRRSRSCSPSRSRCATSSRTPVSR
jgi:uncharacterized protein